MQCLTFCWDSRPVILFTTKYADGVWVDPDLLKRIYASCCQRNTSRIFTSHSTTGRTRHSLLVF